MRRRSLWAMLFGGTEMAAQEFRVDKARLMIHGVEVEWFAGKARNGQWPVCGTMAEPYKPPSRITPTRCKRCNCEFGQDAEDRHD